MDEYVIKMRPYGKARPRVTRTKSGKSHTYMPQAYEASRAELQALYLQQDGVLNREGLLEMRLQFIFKMPKSWSKARREKDVGTYRSKMPDIDNLVGAVMDAIMPESDSNVVFVQAYKIWGLEDAIIIKIEEKNG